jgi:UDP-N-acetylglucosamine/UDP-N-acetylgalactosamine diphosphorylase
MDFLEAKNKLEKLKLTSLLNYYEQGSCEEKAALLKQIEEFDHSFYLRQKEILNTPLSPVNLSPLSKLDERGNAQAKKIGLFAFEKGQVGAILIAGGQGSRLNFSGPKGTYPITPVRKKSLFQVFCEKTYFCSKLVQKKIPLAIMTSPLNHEETVAYFKHNQYFSLDEEQVFFFCQKVLPCLDANQKPFLTDPCSIATAPNGNGSLLKLFYQSGIYQKWKEQGIRYLSLNPIDNPLNDPFDFELTGTSSRLFSEKSTLFICQFKGDFF